MKDSAPVSITLVSAQVQYLEEMARRHGLPDVGKAVRCLVNYARETPDQEEAIFDEVRCVDC